MERCRHKNSLNSSLRLFFQKQVCLSLKQFCLTISLETQVQFPQVGL